MRFFILVLPASYSLPVPFSRGWLPTTASSSLNNAPADGARIFSSQAVDHFDHSNTDVWGQEYFVNDTWFSGDGPVFLCVGGEGPAFTPDVVVTGTVHCGIMVNHAKKWGALIVALQHRYYGHPPHVPTPDLSTPNLKFLSSQQALADISSFHAEISRQYHLTSENRWISFGGSYPGMLAAWSRSKYPHLIHAAVSSSSPVQAQLNMQGYNDVVANSMANTYVGGSSSCLVGIKSAFSALGDALGTSSGRASLASQFGICADQLNGDFWSSSNLVGMLAGMFQGLAQGNDPACEDSSCNIKLACAVMSDQSITPLQRLAKLASGSEALVSESDADCIDVSYETNQVLPYTNTSYAFGRNRIWFWQTCTQFAFYQTCDPTSSCPFTTSPWVVNLTSSLDQCDLAFGIKPDQVSAAVEHSNVMTGGWNLSATNIMFVNGDIDPWHALSVTDDKFEALPDATLNEYGCSGPSMRAIVVKGASHHFWTHAPKSSDGPHILAARSTIIDQIDAWLSTSSTPSGNGGGVSTATAFLISSGSVIGGALITLTIVGIVGAVMWFKGPSNNGSPQYSTLA